LIDPVTFLISQKKE